MSTAIDSIESKRDLIKRTLCRGGSDDELEMFIHQCRRTGSRNKLRHAHGERSGTSKLTVEEVLAIRSDWRPQAQIAAEYGIRQTAVSAIRRRKLWKHV